MKKLNFLQEVPVSAFINERGYLGVCELEGVIPFSVKRVYFISDVPTGQSRGRHGHKSLEQVFLCLKGSFELNVTDGENFDRQVLTQNDAFYAPSGLWRDLVNFSDDAVCLVLASAPYDVSDYIHDYSEFLNWKKS